MRRGSCVAGGDAVFEETETLACDGAEILAADCRVCDDEGCHGLSWRVDARRIAAVLARWRHSPVSRAEVSGRHLSFEAREEIALFYAQNWALEKSRVSSGATRTRSLVGCDACRGAGLPDRCGAVKSSAPRRGAARRDGRSRPRSRSDSLHCLRTCDVR